MSSSIISSNQQPDPSQTGLFDTPRKLRQRNYQLILDNYTFVSHVLRSCSSISSFVCRAFETGNSSSALYHIAVLLDPISEAAQKWSSLMGVGAGPNDVIRFPC